MFKVFVKNIPRQSTILLTISLKYLTMLENLFYLALCIFVFSIYLTCVSLCNHLNCFDKLLLHPCNATVPEIHHTLFLKSNSQPNQTPRNSFRCTFQYMYLQKCPTLYPFIYFFTKFVKNVTLF